MKAVPRSSLGDACGTLSNAVSCAIFSLFYLAVWVPAPAAATSPDGLSAAGPDMATSLASLEIQQASVGPPPPDRRATTEASGLPHAVIIEDVEGRHRHLHVAAVIDGGKLTDGFGRRRHTMGGSGTRHTGIDIAAPSGTGVRAAADGQVVEMGWSGGFGRLVRIRHCGGIETAYAHLSGFAKRLVVGQQVRRNQIIGYVGTSGRSTGPHLHYEIRRNGQAVNPLALQMARQGG